MRLETETLRKTPGWRCVSGVLAVGVAAERLGASVLVGETGAPLLSVEEAALFWRTCFRRVEGFLVRLVVDIAGKTLDSSSSSPATEPSSEALAEMGADDDDE